MVSDMLCNPDDTHKHTQTQLTVIHDLENSYFCTYIPKIYI